MHNLYPSCDCRSSKMEMTTPVFSTAGQGEVDSRMEFPMERKYGQDVEALPQPNDARSALSQGCGFVAVPWRL